LLFVALLVAVDFSYRRWVRRTSSRRLSARRTNPVVIDLAAVDRTGGEKEVASPEAPGAEDAAIPAMPARDAPSRRARTTPESRPSNMT
jgi:hypothetical protein